VGRQALSLAFLRARCCSFWSAFVRCDRRRGRRGGAGCGARARSRGRYGSLLEARARWSGRIATLHPHRRWPVVELGAGFVHGRPAKTLRLLAEANLTLSEVGASHVELTNGGLVTAKDFLRGRGEGCSCQLRSRLKAHRRLSSSPTADAFRQTANQAKGAVSSSRFPLLRAA